MNRYLHLLLFVLLLPTSSLRADWPQWRGPGAQGHTDSKNLPVTWSEEENVKWKTPIPGRGYSSPVIANNQIWVTTAFETKASPEETKKRLKANTGSQPLTLLSSVRMHAICLDSRNGEVIHDIELLKLKDPQWVHQLNSYASPTPVLTEGRLYCHFGTHGNACVDTNSGKLIWSHSNLNVMHENGPGSSPVIYKDMMILNYDGSDKQFVTGLNKQTGKPVWKTSRSGEMHENPQLQKAYGTPLMMTLDGTPTLLSNGANWLYAYDPMTGKELWKSEYGQLGFSNVSRPVGDGKRIYLSTGYMRSKLTAFDINRKSGKKAWEYDKGVPKICSPLLVGNEIYFSADKGGIVTCLNATSGEEIWRERIGGDHSSSPLYASGKIYFHSVNGVTTVIQAGREFKKLADNKLDGKIYASAAVEGDSLVIRTDKALYCIAE